MPSRKTSKGSRAIKTNPELFSDEIQTLPERILDKLEHEKQLEEHHKEATPNYYQKELDFPQAPVASAETRILDLLNKYNNGDPDVDYSQRFDHKEEYKQELITLLRQYGISYIKKHHYPLSKAELHVIRMDFFGRIREPDWDKLSPLYKGYLSLKRKSITDNTNSAQTQNTAPESDYLLSSAQKMTTYPLKAYDLSKKSEWSRIYRLFPRFHNLEHRMLKTIQSMHIPPEQLALMNIYDFSDVLYRTFRKSEDSRDAHLFLGARQCFIKDVFKKHEKWIRAYLERQNIHPRYIDALIKAAQSKGVTNDINISSDAHTCMSEYAAANAEDFQNFIIQSIKSDDYASEIRAQIQNNAFTIDNSAKTFLDNTQKQFSQFIKKHLLEESYVISLYEQFSHEVPSYILDDIRSYLKEKPQLFSKYLQNLDISPNLQHNIVKNLPDLNNPEQFQIVKQFILNKQDDFFVYLLENNRSVNYARVALQTLDDTPQLTDFGKDIISSFILEEENKPTPELPDYIFEQIKTKGLTDNILKKVSPYVRHHFSALQNYFQQNNVLTLQELQNELIENNTLLIQHNPLPDSMNNLHKSFVLSNTPYFKDWYINFHTQRYKENASMTYEQLAVHGINDNNSGICCDFIKERLSNFMEYAAQSKLSSSEIINQLTEDKILENQVLSKTVHTFIIRHNSTFKNFLLQNHLQQKETNFDLMIKKIKQQGISEKSSELIHKFIIDNQPLYTEYQRKNKQIGQQAEQIYDRIIHNKQNKQDKLILKEYLNENIYNYMIFQQDNSQLLPYVKNIVQNTKHTKIGSTEEHWLKAYSANTSDKFKDFLVDNHYMDKEKSETLVKNIEFTKKHMIVTFNDGSVLKIVLEVHHKDAIKDSAEIIIGNRRKVPSTEEKIQKQAEDLLQRVMTENRRAREDREFKKILNEMYHSNIAQINDFRNLCIFPEFWHKVMHSMDSTEPVEDRERYVARLMPTDPNIIFYGSEKPEDQLCYDYANDQRTKRYNRHLSELVAINAKMER